MPIFRGVGERIKTRLRALGYVKPNGDLRVQDFCLDHRYGVTLMYDWMADRRTPIKDLEQLARDLQTTPAYLLFGVEAEQTPAVGAPRRVSPTPKDRRPKRLAPIRGGAGAALPPPADPDSEHSASYQTLDYHRWGLRAA